MRYTIPQLEGLAEALSKINKDIDKQAKKDTEPLTGEDAINSLMAHGLLQ